MSIEDFYDKIIYFFPSVAEEMKVHLLEYGERLDTIVFEDIIMPKVLDLLKRRIDEIKLKDVFNYFEEVCINSDDYLNNVFSITILEILGNEKDVLEKAKSYMGPVTTKMQREADLAIGRKV